MSLDLIFHIGFPKCASTTLQNKVFKLEDGYLGTYKGLSKQDNFAKKFQSFSPVGPRLWGNLSEAVKWARTIRRIRDEQYPNIDRLIISSESLTNRNKISDTPLIDFLWKFERKIWQEGSVKVLLILRNPAEKLASGYAQVSGKNRNAGQEDFEKYLHQQLKSDKLLRYDKWVASLYRRFGIKNTKILLMEDIDSPTFWNELKAFCKLKEFDPEKWVEMNTERSNSSKREENTWELSVFDPNKKAKTFCLNWFGLLWPQYVANSSRQVIFEKCVKRLTIHWSRSKQVIGHDTRTITLTPDLRCKIQDAYKKNTSKLSKLLQRDLRELGY